MSHRALLFSIILSVFTSLAVFPPVHASGVVQDDEYDVINALLAESKNKAVFVIDTDNTPYNGSIFKLYKIEADREMVKDYTAKNTRSFVLQTEWITGRNLFLRTQAEMDAIFTRDNGWKLFRQKYPGRSILQVSRVGFNPAHTKALLSHSIRYGGKAGAGYFTIFAKRNGRWVRDRSLRAWIS